MNAPEFVQKWAASQRAERAAAQEHFIDLCGLLGQPTPNSDPTGERYAFEKGAAKTSGGDGWADVWLRERFGWEYKGRHKNLAAAYQQLLQYREVELPRFSGRLMIRPQGSGCGASFRTQPG